MNTVTQVKEPVTTHRSERTNVLVATAGLALVLLVSPLSTLATVAVVLTMVGIAVTFRLTASPGVLFRHSGKCEPPIHTYAKDNEADQPIVGEHR